MRIREVLVGAALCAVMAAQQPPQTPPGGGRGGRGGGGGGGFVPGQQRKPEDPEQVARGKALYGISCTACHGADLRGGDMGGPNLLRSQLTIVDKEGEMIVPIIEKGRGAMPPIQMPPADAKAVATFVRSQMAMIGRQGMPPGVGKEPPSILVGDAKAGQQYFDAKCAKCHSATGDLKGLATRINDPRALQNSWVAGGGGGRRGGRGGAPAGPSDRRTVTAVVTPASGPAVEGQLLRIDDFLVTLKLADNTVRSFTRDGNVPKVEVRDPMKPHRDLLTEYTDKNIHDVTAYLVTLK